MNNWIRTSCKKGEQYLINLDNIASVKYRPEEESNSTKSPARVVYFLSGCDTSYIAEEFISNETALEKFNFISSILGNPPSDPDDLSSDDDKISLNIKIR